MTLIDEILLEAKAGRGGDGVVRWLREKSRPFGGPAGGNGGRGGDVYLKGVRDIGRLHKYKHDTTFKAQDGAPGGSKHMHGKHGSDCIIEVPIGSLVSVRSKEKQYDILDETPVKILNGGNGGLGNNEFKSSTNRSPIESTKGKNAQESVLHVVLRLIADAGLIGLPNAGKSSLLNAITNAHAKVGNYQFTTLDPNLGDLFGYVLADIPGLIEGASEGKGLGFKFLKHIERTKVLLHCISLENEDIGAVQKIILGELKAFNPELLEKQEVIVLTKTDMVSEADLAKQVKIAKKWGKEVLTVSIYDDASIKVFADTLIKILRG